jgi:hypothetical protein
MLIAESLQVCMGGEYEQLYGTPSVKGSPGQDANRMDIRRSSELWNIYQTLVFGVGEYHWFL